MNVAREGNPVEYRGSFGIINGISTIARQLGGFKKMVPLGEAAFLCVALFMATFFVSSAGKDEKIGVLGGPAPVFLPKTASLAEQAALVGVPLVARASQGDSSAPIHGSDPSGEVSLTTLSDNGAIFGGVTAQGGVIAYTVKKGDTLSSVASQFGVSVETIVGANPGLKARSLKVGQEITVLSISGILYRLRDGETPESVASSFGLSLSQLQEFNRSVDFNAAGPGSTLLIPGARAQGVTRGFYEDLPRILGYFTAPTEGFNWGKLHSYNAVDIANACGTPVFTAAEGLVIPDKEYGSGDAGWSGGYGKFVLIEHPNGTKTRYAHLDSVSVEIGEYVSQKQQVGTMGNTGNVHGPTGCHLHFEVYGAQNPMVR